MHQYFHPSHFSLNNNLSFPSISIHFPHSPALACLVLRQETKSRFLPTPKRTLREFPASGRGWFHGSPWIAPAPQLNRSHRDSSPSPISSPATRSSCRRLQPRNPPGETAAVGLDGNGTGTQFQPELGHRGTSDYLSIHLARGSSSVHCPQAWLAIMDDEQKN